MYCNIHPTTRNVNGYATCWYCGRPCVDATIYAVSGPSGYDGPATIAVCDADECAAAADSGSIDPTHDAGGYDY